MSLPERYRYRIVSLFKLCLFTLVCVLIIQEPVLANRPIQTYLTSNVAGTPANFTAVPYATPCGSTGANAITGCAAAGVNTNMNFGSGNNIQLNGMVVDVAGTPTFFEPALNLTTTGTGLANRVVFRRSGVANPATGSTTTEQAFWEFDTLVLPGGGTGSINLRPNNAATLADAMLSRTINRGIDNTFNNVATPLGQETRNNIERIDYIIDAPGVASPANLNTVGFAILERGGNDAFQVAAITGLDVAGNPSSYKALTPGGSGAYGGGAAANIETAVLRSDNPPTTSNPFRLSHRVPAQDIRGRFFTLADLGIVAGDFVFGYSIFAGDVPVATLPNDLVDINNTTVFPRTTDGGVNGIDLIAGGIIFSSPAAQDFQLFKRITNLTDSAGAALTTLDFTTEESTTGIAAIVKSAGIDPVGLTSITNVPLSTGNQIEYTIYYASPTSNSTAVNICDQIPSGTTFIPDTYTATSGIQVINPGNPVGAATTHTNANDGDTGRFEAVGAVLPGFCGTSAGNGAVIEEGLTVNAGQAGRITFRVSVN